MALAAVAVLALTLVGAATTARWSTALPITSDVVQSGTMSLLVGADAPSAVKQYSFTPLALEGKQWSPGTFSQAPLTIVNAGNVPIRQRLSAVTLSAVVIAPAATASEARIAPAATVPDAAIAPDATVASAIAPAATATAPNVATVASAVTPAATAPVATVASATAPVAPVASAITPAATSDWVLTATLVQSPAACPATAAAVGASIQIGAGVSAWRPLAVRGAEIWCFRMTLSPTASQADTSSRSITATLTFTAEST